MLSLSFMCSFVVCTDSYANSCLYLLFVFLSFKDTDWGRVAKNLSQIPGIGRTVKISMHVLTLYCPKCVAGIVETGLFLEMAECVYLGNPNGVVNIVYKGSN